MKTKEENKAYHRAYYLAHKEDIGNRTRAWAVSNKERVKAYLEDKYGPQN